MSHCDISDPHSDILQHTLTNIIFTLNFRTGFLKTLDAAFVEWFRSKRISINWNFIKCKELFYLNSSYFIKMKNSFLVFKMCSEVLKSDFLSQSLFINIYIFFSLANDVENVEKFLPSHSWSVLCNPFESKNVRRYSNFSFPRDDTEIYSTLSKWFTAHNCKLWTGKFIGIHKNYSIKQ